jgi:tetratricopeptide (TPR) repeat protein
MQQGEQYAEQLSELQRHIAEPVRGIILLEFATIPQIEGIIAGLRALDPSRACIEVLYDSVRENAVLYLDRIRREVSAFAPNPLPLLILRPLELPDSATDHAAAVEFWRAFNFRRETLGSLPAQILLCVDPWHHDRLVDYAGDLRSWTAPKFHLIADPAGVIEPTEGLAALSSFVRFGISPDAAERRWETFWPELEKARAEHRIEPGHFRRYVLPLLEAALAQGNLNRARQVRDAAQGARIAEEDIVQWHWLNAMLACAGNNFPSAEEHIRKLSTIARKHSDEPIRRKALAALLGCTSLIGQFGQFGTAEELLREQCRLSEELNGPEHPHTLASRNNLSIALQAQGKHAEAEREDRAVLAVRERALGPEHVETMGSRSNLASALQAQGKYAEAERENRLVLSIRERMLGPEHPETLASRNNLALVLRAQGKNSEAEREHRAELEISERMLGSEHPDTLKSRNNLAGALQAQGKYEEAEYENRIVQAARERVLGAEHPETLTSRSNLAISLQARGRYAEAEQENRAVLRIRERVLGSGHPDTLTSRSNLAVVLGAQGKKAEAERESGEVLALRERMLGPEDPLTLASRSNLAFVMQAQGKNIEAEREHRAVLAIRERVLGPKHPEVFRSCYNIALCSQIQGNVSEALKFARRALKGWREVLGEQHPDTRNAKALAERLQEENTASA